MVDPIEPPERPPLLGILPYIGWVSVLLLAAIALVLLSVGGADVRDAVTSVAAVAALIGAALSIRLTRRISRVQLTYSYIPRISDPHRTALLGEYLWLQTPPERLNQEFWKRLTEDERKQLNEEWRRKSLEERQNTKRHLFEEFTPDEQLEVVAHLNLIEEIAVAFNAGLLDKRLVKGNIAPWTEFYLQIGRWFVDWRRESDPTELRDWVRMQRKLDAMPEDADRELGRRPTRWLHRLMSAARGW